MATLSAGRPVISKTPLFAGSANSNREGGFRGQSKRWIFFAALITFASLAVAQNAPQITGVDPAEGKANDKLTLSGTDLGKTKVASVYLSNDKEDFKAAIVDQSDTKITVTVPQIKPGDYNVSLEVGDKLFIKPVKFKVDQ